jgi:imidazolonepropionase
MNSGFVRGDELAILPSIKDAFIIIEDDTIAETGAMENFRFSNRKNSIVPNTIVLPCWCDSHTHILFAASREEEFIDKIK